MQPKPVPSPENAEGSFFKPAAVRRKNKKMKLVKVNVMNFPHNEEMWEGTLRLSDLEMRQLREILPDKEVYNFYPKTGFVTVRDGAIPLISEFIAAISCIDY